jgi:hypothetical protein
MNTLLDILKGIIYVIVSLIIISALGIIYLGFVIFEVTKELVRYINRRIQ